MIKKHWTDEIPMRIRNALAAGLLEDRFDVQKLTKKAVNEALASGKAAKCPNLGKKGIEWLKVYFGLMPVKKKWSVIGCFDYVGCKIALYALEDETIYRVIDEFRDYELETGTLTDAKDKFYECVQNAFFTMSTSDASVYMQQKAPLVEL